MPYVDGTTCFTIFLIGPAHKILSHRSSCLKLVVKYRTAADLFSDYLFSSQEMTKERTYGIRTQIVNPTRELSKQRMITNGGFQKVRKFCVPITTRTQIQKAIITWELLDTTGSFVLDAGQREEEHMILLMCFGADKHIINANGIRDGVARLFHTFSGTAEHDSFSHSQGAVPDQTAGTEDNFFLVHGFLDSSYKPTPSTCLHMTATPPHPPPSVHEKAPSTKLEVLLKQRSGPLLVKMICWAAALTEAAVILAARNPKLPMAQEIVAKLVFSGNVDGIRPTPLFFLGIFMTGLGGYIRYSCYRALGRLFTFEMCIRNEHQLITNGPYRVVRHPAYTGVILTMAGIICWHSSPGSWIRECGILETKLGQSAASVFIAFISTLMAGLMLRMSKEDAALKNMFGDQWDNWARIVPYSLIPWIY